MPADGRAGGGVEIDLAHELRHLDGDGGAAHGDLAAGDRMVVREDLDEVGVALREPDHRAAAHPQHTLQRQAGLSEDDREVYVQAVERGGHPFPPSAPYSGAYPSYASQHFSRNRVKAW